MLGRGETILGAALLGLAGCHDSLDLGADGTPSIPEPQFPWNGLPTPAPSPTPIADFGDGHHGALVVTGTQVVNDCAEIESVSGSMIDTDGDPFAVGDRVLLWQVQDAFASFGDAAGVTEKTMALAGVWQLARVVDTSASSIDVDVKPYAYGGGAAGRSAQACLVPEYTDAIVNAGGRIEAAAWTPLAGGGIVAFFVDGTLDLQGVLSASGRGFTGATAHLGSNAGNDVTQLDTASADGGRKGAGLDARAGNRYGAGNYANGAGGGNAHSGGGGGGGNAGAGGSGGKQWKPSGDVAGTAGRGGAPVLASYPTRLVMGGGGGEGQCHHGGCGDGGDGGGIVLVFARTITGSGEIRSNGDAAGASMSDAGSGGGAGGTIVVITEVSSFTGALRANGGDGADATYDDDPTDPAFDPATSGPGGGGGGGWIHFRGSTVAVSVSAQGGANGVNPLAGDDPWGATSGGPGTIITPD